MQQMEDKPSRRQPGQRRPRKVNPHDTDYHVAYVRHDSNEGVREMTFDAS